MTPQRAVARRLYLWLVVAALAAVAVLIVVMRSSLHHQVRQTDPSSAEDLTITIDQQTFDLRNGIAEVLRPIRSRIGPHLSGQLICAAKNCALAADASTAKLVGPTTSAGSEKRPAGQV